MYIFVLYIYSSESRQKKSLKFFRIDLSVKVYSLKNINKKVLSALSDYIQDNLFYLFFFLKNYIYGVNSSPFALSCQHTLCCIYICIFLFYYLAG